jgi:hypothetical protein
VFKAVHVFALQKSNSPKEWLKSKERLEWYKLGFYSIYAISKAITIITRITKINTIENGEDGTEARKQIAIVDLVSRLIQLAIILPIDIALFRLTIHFIKIKIKTEKELDDEYEEEEE